MEAGEKVPTYKDPEWQANTLAAELLMPIHLIKGKAIQEIAYKCEVSYTAAAIQLKYV